MRHGVFISLVAVLGAAACAGPAPRPQPGVGGMAWAFYETPEEGAKLVFGKPNTDDVPVMMTCQPRSDRVRISVSGPDQVLAGAVIVLRSGTAISRLPATYDADEGLGARLEGATSAHDPALQGFAASGHLTIQVPGNAGSTPAGDPQRVRNFMKACSR